VHFVVVGIFGVFYCFVNNDKMGIFIEIFYHRNHRKLPIGDKNDETFHNNFRDLTSKPLAKLSMEQAKERKREAAQSSRNAAQISLNRQIASVSEQSVRLLRNLREVQPNRSFQSTIVLSEHSEAHSIMQKFLVIVKLRLRKTLSVVVKTTFVECVSTCLNLTCMIPMEYC
jgi:hypothetical protein